MGMYSSGLIALDKRLATTKTLLEQSIPESLEKLGEHRGHVIYKVPYIKMYGARGLTFIAWVETLPPEDFIMAIAYEEGTIDTDHGDWEEFGMTFEQDDSEYYIKLDDMESDYV